MKEYIEFELINTPEEINYKPKTQRWAVQTKEDYTQLGIIKWRNGWRKYAFYPYSETLFEEDCLRFIAKFIEDKTTIHKKGKKNDSTLGKRIG